MHLIGLTGKKRAGKDTCANYIHSRWPCASLAFADPIRAALVAMFEVNPILFTHQDFKEHPQLALLGQTPRHLMQTLGTEWGRDCVSDTLWIELLGLKLSRLAVEGDVELVVVTDVRFPNEADLIRQHGGEIWKIERMIGEGSSGEDPHRSEAEDIHADHLLTNPGHLDGLPFFYGQIDWSMNELLA